MKHISIVLGIGMFFYTTILHFQVSGLQTQVAIEETITLARLKKAFEAQERILKKQETVLLKHTVGIQDRLAYVEAQGNECRFQVAHLNEVLESLTQKTAQPTTAKPKK
jgi:hypothetical protein